MAEAAIPIAVGGGLIGAYANIKSAEAEAEAMEFESNLKRSQGVQIRAQFNREAELTSQEGDAIVAEQESRYRGSGIDSTTGSPLLMMANTKALAEKEAFQLRTEGENRARTLYTTASYQDRMAGERRTLGYIEAASTLLGSGAQVARLGSMK